MLAPKLLRIFYLLVFKKNYAKNFRMSSNNLIKWKIIQIIMQDVLNRNDIRPYNHLNVQMLILGIWSFYRKITLR